MMAKKSDPPPEEGQSWLARYVVEDYEPVLDRLGTERRVLGHISDEDHVGRGPRNTVARLAQELAEDPNTAVEFDEDDVIQEHLNTLEEAGLIERRKDATYGITDAGYTEMAN
jgi:DNA-binding transcriptional ArsR family regulator